VARAFVVESEAFAIMADLHQPAGEV